MRRVVIAPDSFKGALSAPEAAQAIASGLRRVWPDVDTVLLPIADGGEGTLDALVTATQGRKFAAEVTGPLSEMPPVIAHWGLLGDGETAVVELAEAAGLTRLPSDRRDPKYTTTRGVGELLHAAIVHPGVRRVIVGLGGSATNEGGAGLLTALGVRLLDSTGGDLHPGGADLARLASVDTSTLLIDPASVELLIACDVDNPLTGPHGAAAVFGPQKGATPDDVAVLDAALARYASVLETGGAGGLSQTPGAGAAGGTTVGLLWLFPRAVLRPGIDLVLDAVGFDDAVQRADLVITGEGRLDAQTLGGKAVAGIAERTRRATDGRVPVAALVGSLDPQVSGETLARQLGVQAALAIAPGPCTLADSITHAADWLADAAERAARWMTLGMAIP